MKLKKDITKVISGVKLCSSLEVRNNERNRNAKEEKEREERVGEDKHGKERGDEG